MNNRTALLVALLGMVGWAIAVWLLFGDSSDKLRLGSSYHPQPANETADHTTAEGPPLIRLVDLPALGFDDATIQRIEPHFHVLNAALVTLVELHEQYDTATTADIRRHLQSEAVSFHMTADRHEESIEGALPARLVAPFHDYMRRRERAAGLPEDAEWHLHRRPGHGSSFRGIVHDSSRTGGDRK